jgi:hypothetical protein
MNNDCSSRRAIQEMIDQDAMTFLQEIDNQLATHGSLAKVAEARGENYNGLHSKITRMGYKVVGRLVPINAPDVAGSQQPAA